jgi:intracellular sulfur oxidation DsrE/DsrF family protein
MQSATKSPMMMSIALVAALVAMPALAQTQTTPRLVPDFGAYNEVPDPFEKPDPTLRYKVVFDVSQAARTPGSVHQGLERVARMVNLLNHHGVKVLPGDIVVTMHGPAAKTSLTAAAFAKRFSGEANPNAELIKQLTAAGVSVRLCGQSMVAAGFARDEINPDVKIDIAAITTMATYQLRGYAIIQD